MIRNPLARYYPWLGFFWVTVLWQSNFDVSAVIVCGGMAWLFWKFDKIWRSL